VFVWTFSILGGIELEAFVRLIVFTPAMVSCIIEWDVDIVMVVRLHRTISEQPLLGIIVERNLNTDL